MFYCEKCRAANGWPDSYGISKGPCEMCGRVVYCYDVPSSQLPKPSPTPESPQMPSKATELVQAIQTLAKPRSPQQALMDAINSGAVAHWASGGRVLCRKWGTGDRFVPSCSRPDFSSVHFEWQMAPAIEYPATPEALLQVMQSVLMDCNHDARHFDSGVTDRDEARMGLGLLAAKLDLQQWEQMANQCFE